MTKGLVTPHLRRISELLLRRAGLKAEDEAFHIVAVSEFLPLKLQNKWPEIANIWRDSSLGKVINEGNPDSERALWSFSDKGLAEAARLIRLERQRSWRVWCKRNALTILGVLAAVVASVATSISAYIAYLEMK